MKVELNDFELRLLYKYLKRTLWFGTVFFSRSHAISLRLILERLDEIYYGLKL